MHPYGPPSETTEGWGTRCKRYMDNRKPAKTMVLVVIVAALAIGAALAYGTKCAIFHSPNACISEELMNISDLDGVKVEVIYTNCDTLAKEETVEVYFSRAAVKGDSWYARWRSHRTVVFSYDPTRWDSQLPSITHPSPSTILISIPAVSSVQYKSRKWQDLSINYAIGKVY
jgi:hypothetical protein